MSKTYIAAFEKGVEARKLGYKRLCVWRDSEYQLGWYHGWDAYNNLLKISKGDSRETLLSL